MNWIPIGLNWTILFKCLEMTIVVIWRSINKTELNWIENIKNVHIAGAICRRVIDGLWQVFFRQLFLAVPRDGRIMTQTLLLLFLLVECTAHSASVPGGLIYHCVIYKPGSPRTPLQSALTSLWMKVSLHSTGGAAGSMIDLAD